MSTSSSILLEKMVARDCVPQALLLVGDPLFIKKEAKTFAAQLVGGAEQEQHPDIHTLLPEGKTGMHSVRSIRAMFGEVGLTPYSGKKKVFIVEECDRMLPTSSNALLKTLEEPPERTIFILLTNHREKILPTLLSRCHTLYFPQTWQKKWSLLQEEFLECLKEGSSFEKITKKIEESKKELEKKLSESSEEGEVEAAVTLHYQEEVRSLFEVYHIYYKEAYAANLGVEAKYLAFAQKRELIPIKLFEKRLKEAELALERGMALKSILEYLL